jgi:succinyl-CoA synthetase beta subunit
MNLREYQAKKIFANSGIPIPPGKVARSSKEVEQITSLLNSPVVLKPQLGIKKRGKLGIIKFANNPAEAATAATDLFKLTVKEEQIKIILVETKVEIKQEFYLAVTIDYCKRNPVLIISLRGGVDIEKLAKKEPDQLLKLPINILEGLIEKDIIRIKEFAGDEIARHAFVLYSIFRKYDAELVEINPIVKTADYKIIAVDGVLNINDDSLFRHSNIAELRKEYSDIDPIAEEARANNWTYIDLPGDIAILSSGAGLTMTILDLINFAGGSPANFIDTAQIDEEGIYQAFKLLVKAKSAKTLLINIFAGLNRCDSLAKGIQRYLNDFPLDIPIVIRMVGNKEKEGHEILRGIGIEPFSKLEEAVKKVVEISK